MSISTEKMVWNYIDCLLIVAAIFQAKMQKISLFFLFNCESLLILFGVYIEY